MAVEIGAWQEINGLDARQVLMMFLAYPTALAQGATPLFPGQTASGLLTHLFIHPGLRSFLTTIVLIGAFAFPLKAVLDGIDTAAGHPKWAPGRFMVVIPAAAILGSAVYIFLYPASGFLIGASHITSAIVGGWIAHEIWNARAIGRISVPGVTILALWVAEIPLQYALTGVAVGLSQAVALAVAAGLTSIALTQNASRANANGLENESDRTS